MGRSNSGQESCKKADGNHRLLFMGFQCYPIMIFKGQARTFKSKQVSESFLQTVKKGLKQAKFARKQGVILLHASCSPIGAR